MKASDWEKISAFMYGAEYQRFVRLIEKRVEDGLAEEVPVDQKYNPGTMPRERWFKDKASGQVWRLVEPDFPSRGKWEPVRLAAQ